MSRWQRRLLADLLFSYKWSPDLMTFSTFDPEDEEETLDDWARLIGRQPDHKSCYACALKDVTRFRRRCNKAMDGTLSIFDIDYHVNDFVYVYTRSPTLAVAQVRDLLPNAQNDKLEVRLLERVQPYESSSDRANFVSPIRTS